jgi:hypothetical protein
LGALRTESSSVFIVSWSRIMFRWASGWAATRFGRRQLRYVYEGHDGAALRGAAHLGQRARLSRLLGARARHRHRLAAKRVHAEQEIVLHAPLPVAGTSAVRPRVTALWDRAKARVPSCSSSAKSATRHYSGELLATVTQLNLLRGDGGFGAGGSEGAPPRRMPCRRRARLRSCDLADACRRRRCSTA